MVNTDIIANEVNREISVNEIRIPSNIEESRLKEIERDAIAFAKEIAESPADVKISSNILSIGESAFDMDVVMQEVLDEGASCYIERLTDNTNDNFFIKYDIPDGYSDTYKNTVIKFLDIGVTVLGFYKDSSVEMSPDPNRLISIGDSIAVCAKNREDVDKVMSL